MAVNMKKLRARFADLKNQRSPFEARYKLLSAYMLPDAGRFEACDKALLDNRWKYIFDATANDAVGALAAGMLGGITSPARPWFRLSTGDPQADEQYDVRQWLSEVTELLQLMFLGSNVYPALIQCYEELAVFGTACLVALPSEKDDIHPKDKAPIARRLEAIALYDVYKLKGARYPYGPMFKSAKFDGGGAEVEFETGGRGLSGDGRARGFEIKTADGRWVQPAEIKITGDSKIGLSAPGGSRITGVRYLRGAYPKPLAWLRNADGEPAFSFEFQE